MLRRASTDPAKPDFSWQALQRLAWLPRSSMQQPEFWLIGLAILALSLISLDQITQYREIARARDRVAHAILALESVENISKLVLRCETAQRGYLLTGSASYMEPYNRVVHEMPAALSDFKRAARGISLGPENVAKVVELVQAKLDEISQTLKLFRQENPERALALVRTDAGRQLMDELAPRTAEVKHECIRIFTGESQRLAEHSRHSLLLSTAGILTVLVVLLFAGARLRRLFERCGLVLRKLQAASEKYQLLARRVEAVREEERAHLAREIHDTFGQTLTVIKLDVAVAARKMPQNSETAIAAKLDRALSGLDTAIGSLRRVASELRPPLLDAVGLTAAVRAYTVELSERTGLAIRFNEHSELPRLTPDQRITGFRICQESLTNIVRHASATEVRMDILSEAGELQVRIQDNGVGFSTENALARKSLGLLGMQERARLMDGELLIASNPGQGTTVTPRLPLLQPTASESPGLSGAELPSNHE